MSDAVIQETIDGIRKATKKAQQSKKASMDFLVATGIQPDFWIRKDNESSRLQKLRTTWNLSVFSKELKKSR